MSLEQSIQEFGDLAGYRLGADDRIQSVQYAATDIDRNGLFPVH